MNPIHRVRESWFVPCKVIANKVLLSHLYSLYWLTKSFWDILNKLHNTCRSSFLISQFFLVNCIHFVQHKWNHNSSNKYKTHPAESHILKDFRLSLHKCLQFSNFNLFYFWKCLALWSWHISDKRNLICFENRAHTVDSEWLSLHGGHAWFSTLVLVHTHCLITHVSSRTHSEINLNEVN